MVAIRKSWLSSPPEEESGDLRQDDSLGILSFEAAATMSRVVSLHRSLSDSEISKLRSDTMRSQGVAYLNSTDQAYLLRLACAELVEELNRAAATISRFALRCNGNRPLTSDFARVFADLKSGTGYHQIGKWTNPKIKKMEKLIDLTAKLSAETEALEELEAAERKAEKRWGRLSGPIPLQQPNPAGPDSFRLELKAQRQRVRRLKEESLWSMSFDKTVSLLARSACAVFVRICVVFGPFVPGLPRVIATDRTKPLFRFRTKYSSGPIIERREIPINVPISSSCPIFGSDNHRLVENDEKNWSKVLECSPDKVGGAGLALRYANVIVSAERLLQMEAEGREDEAAAEREEMYEMLPAALKSTVRSKLRDRWRDRGPLDQSLAEGWKEAVGRMLTWLGPVARDTVRWHTERSMDRRRRFDTRPRALRLQTLHVSDKEKAEAAIAEVLVGLSCICWYEEVRRGSCRV